MLEIMVIVMTLIVVRVDYESGKYALRKEGFNWVLLIGKQNPQKILSSNGRKGT